MPDGCRPTATVRVADEAASITVTVASPALTTYTAPMPESTAIADGLRPTGTEAMSACA